MRFVLGVVLLLALISVQVRSGHAVQCLAYGSDEAVLGYGYEGGCEGRSCRIFIFLVPEVLFFLHRNFCHLYLCQLITVTML